jgi:hypothetical protein
MLMLLHILFTVFQKLLCIEQAKIIGHPGLCLCLLTPCLDSPPPHPSGQGLQVLNLAVPQKLSQTAQSKELLPPVPF